MEPIPYETYQLIKEIYLTLDDIDRQFMRRFKLSITRFFALSHIHETPGISPIQLSGKLLCDKSNVTRILKSLEAEELIERQSNPNDRRSVHLNITEKGEALYVRADAAHREMITNLFEPISIDTSWVETMRRMQPHLSRMLE